jgi:hypothetical protein
LLVRRSQLSGMTLCRHDAREISLNAGCGRLMPYFFLLPAFVLWVVTLGVAVVVTSLHRPAAGLRPYVVSVLAWSSLGFVLSTIVYAGVLVAAAVAMNRVLAGQPSTIGGIAMGLVVSASACDREAARLKRGR